MKISESWDRLLADYYKTEDWIKLEEFIENEYKTKKIFPKRDDLFTAFRLTPYEAVKAVIIGQDPYHGENQAHGIAFSVQRGTKIPPSLRNIFQELYDDLGVPIPTSGDLTKWALEGVLLLNTVLTVCENQPKSHSNCGWEHFTEKVIDFLNQKTTPIVFILWGNDAKKIGKKITNPNHLKLEGPHPSPLSAFQGFFGKKYFSKCNQFLSKHNIQAIDWNLSK